MCKCCQYYLESCYWHLIEKRFCYDENIALYEEPEKEEKNNNMFENMAFYDSVAVIAGRAVVTIDPLPEIKPIVVQPRLKKPVRWWETDDYLENNLISRSMPMIVDSSIQSQNNSESEDTTPVEAAISIPNLMLNECEQPEIQMTHQMDPTAEPEHSPDVLNVLQLRKKSLLERRMSKSLYLKIEPAREKELPIIRQNSMPKFYLGNPEEHQFGTPLYRQPSTALASPVPVNTTKRFNYDLSSVVRMENERVYNAVLDLSHSDLQGKKQFRDKMVKLRRIKSTLSAFQSHHM